MKLRKLSLLFRVHLLLICVGSFQLNRLAFRRPVGMSSVQGPVIAAENPGLQFFLDFVVDMQEKDSGSVKILSKETVGNSSDGCTTHINSIVFSISDAKDYVLALVDANDRVNVTALHQVLSESGITELGDKDKVTLASSASVEEVCGFAPGTVPPLGFLKKPRITVIDSSLRDLMYLEGGGGVHDMTCRIRLATLVSQPGIKFANLRDKETSGSQLAHNSSGSSVPSFSDFRPFFVAAPPSLAKAESIVQQGIESPIETEWIQAVGRISGVRRMAQKLCFIDFAPINGTHGPYDLPWRNPVDQEPMAVQLVCGKTFCQRLGSDDKAIQALNRLKVGKVITVQGRTNVESIESLKHWISKRSLDIVLWDFQEIGTNLSWRDSNKQDSPNQLRRKEIAGRTNVAKPNKYSFLTVAKAYPGPDVDQVISVVDSEQKIAEFELCLCELDEKFKETGGGGLSLAGLDCEWRPSFYSENEPQPVLLLQVCLHTLRKVFLFDMQALCRPILSPDETLTDLESRLGLALGSLLANQGIVKVGFQLGQDLKRLAASYPHIESFRSVESVLETASLAKIIFRLTGERNVRQVTGSLRALTERVLKYSLDKEEQISDWCERPLTNSQINYAALDAIVTPLITEVLLTTAEMQLFNDGLVLGRDAEDRAFRRALISWRFGFLPSSTPEHAVKKLKAKRIINDEIITGQHWVTGNEPPAMPSVPSTKHSPYVDVSGTVRVPAHTVVLNHDEVSTTIDSIVGKKTGKSKDRCVEAFASGSDNFPEGARLEYKTRSGYIELANAVALFVNMPDKPGKGARRSYPNEWLGDGRVLTWFIRGNDWAQGSSSLAKNMVGTDADAGLTILFVRAGRGHYICCGRCRVVEPDGDEQEESWRLSKLELVLKDWETLMQYEVFHNLVYPGRSVDGCLIPPDSDDSYSSSEASLSD